MQTQRTMTMAQIMTSDPNDFDTLVAYVTGITRRCNIVAENPAAEDVTALRTWMRAEALSLTNHLPIDVASAAVPFLTSGDMALRTGAYEALVDFADAVEVINNWADEGIIATSALATADLTAALAENNRQWVLNAQAAVRDYPMLAGWDDLDAEGTATLLVAARTAMAAALGDSAWEVCQSIANAAKLLRLAGQTAEQQDRAIRGMALMVADAA